MTTLDKLKNVKFHQGDWKLPATQPASGAKNE